ncbi:MAG: hypothetical protein LiPW15_93 [Parcubacteria group bacterium LiPW_15]|nr:MAG: hypothetical protein LiPW15_93 [Parcubacteria group bacterium LiPW_15]
MRIKDLFKSTGISQSFGGVAPRLDKNNCRVENKTKNEDSVLLRLKRMSDGEEGNAYLRVQEQFSSITPQLLGWAFNSNKIIGLSLNELDDFETGLEIENLQGRLRLITD